MKTAKIVLVSAVLASLVGCTSSVFEKMGKPIYVEGDPDPYTGILQERVNPWGINMGSMYLVKSDRVMVLVPQNGTPTQPTKAAEPAMQNCPTQHPGVVANHPTASATREVVVIKSSVVSANNQGCPGLAVGAFEGSVGATMQGLGMMGAACLLKPARISAVGGGGAAAASSSSSSAAAAASGP